MMVRNKKNHFPIVCVGGSAGGLEAFQELLQNLSPAPGMAFVFIMHLSPTAKSILPELLSKQTKMQVRVVKNNIPVNINCVYVIQPNTNIVISNDKLIVSPQKAGKHMPIDYFLNSLAAAKESLGIAVILSGTGEDGTIGVEAIKSAGGISFAQTQESAKFGDMPASAAATGKVDFVLTPAKIAYELKFFSSHAYFSVQKTGADGNDSETDASADRIPLKGLSGIIELVRRAKRVDFSDYKMSTIKRRVFRRMLVTKAKNIRAYTALLRKSSAEQEHLFQELLINVTSFFRDAEVFEELKNKVIPQIMKGKGKNDPLRIWVTACSSGEEAYSVAICVLEVLGRKTEDMTIQIFATDVNESNIDKARFGVYGRNIESNVSQERLRRYFVKESGGYRISKLIRQMCVFSVQNIITDPPFSNIDLVSCRNLLIYLDPVLQKKAFRNIYYAIRPEGMLLLGKSESTGSFSQGFKIASKAHRTYVKKYAASTKDSVLDHSFTLPMIFQGRFRQLAKAAEGPGIQPVISIEEKIEQMARKEYSPCGVLISSELEILYFKGPTGKYLETAAGKPNLNIFKLCRQGLFLPLRTAVKKAKKTNRAIRTHAEVLVSGGRIEFTNLSVIPVRKGSSVPQEFMIFFSKANSLDGGEQAKSGKTHIQVKGAMVEVLRKELMEAKAYLQEVVEEQESVKEDMSIAAEEIQSSNEELQSTNEELETAKEELQSSNEELMTSNAEMQSRNSDISVLNSDLANLLGSINLPVVMTDTGYLIRRVTNECEEALNISSADVGRSLISIKLKADVPELEELLAGVLKTLNSRKIEFESKEGKWFALHLNPYRTLDNRIDGVVLVFMDITRLKFNEREAVRAKLYSENIVETIQESILILDPDLKVNSANKTFYETFLVKHANTIGRFVFDLGDGQWNIPNLRSLLEDLTAQGRPFRSYRLENNFAGIGNKVLLLSGRHSHHLNLIIISIVDITETTRLEEQLIQSQKMEAVGQLAAGVSHEFNNLLAIMQLSVEEALELKSEGGFLEMGKSLKASIQQAAFIARRLNEFARPNALEEWSCDVAKSVDGALKMMDNNFKIKRVQVKKNYGKISQTNLDERMLTQVLLNLFRNAEQAMPEGGDLMVDVFQLQNTIFITVEDTGHGIEKEHLGKVFTPFYTTKGAFGTGKVAGVGLGLAVSYSIMKNIGGSISVESQLGKGAKFTVSLPVKVVAMAKTPAPFVPANPIGAVKPSLAITAGKKVLVVDDEAAIRDLLCKLLILSGYTVETANDGASCLEKLASFKPDLLILDLLMPQTNIEELIKRIALTHQALKKIIVTGAGDADLKRLEPIFAASGITKVLTKPFDAIALKQALASEF